MTAIRPLPAPLLTALFLGALALVLPLAPLQAAGEDPEESRWRQAARLRSLALAAMEQEDYAGAAGSLEDLARLLPDNILPPLNLAICYQRLGRHDRALAEIERARGLDPDNPRMLYTLARLLEDDPERAGLRRRVLDHFAARHPGDPRPAYLRALPLLREQRFAEAAPALEQALERAPENLVLLADLLVAAAGAGEGEAALDALDAIEDRLDGFDAAMADHGERIRELAQTGRLEALRPAALVMRNLLRPGEIYRLHMEPLVGAGRQAGGGVFPQREFDPLLPGSVQGGRDIDFRFEEAAGPAAERLPPRAHWIRLNREPGRESLLGVGAEGLVEAGFAEGGLRSVFEQALPVAGIPISCDIDQDGLTDLAAIETGGIVRLYRGLDGGSFAAPVQIFEPPDSGRAAGLFPLDIDHEGDLDLLVARREAPDLYLQNNGDGTWTEAAEELGIAGGAVPTTDLSSADFDDDGDLDLLTVHGAGRPPRLYLNRRTGRLHEAGAAWGLDGPAGRSRLATADFDNDGRFDLLLWGGGPARLLRNTGAAFEPAPLPPGSWSTARVADYDNDGDQDLVAVPAGGSEPVLLRNRGGTLAMEPTGLAAAGAEELIDGDLDGDGDLDLMAHAPGAPPRVWRNDGGNRNQWVRLSLRGKNDNNAKNNVQGLFCRVEARVGDRFQVVLGNGGVNHLGLGSQRAADVIRVVWTNGLAQSRPLVSAGQTLVEEQVLKGSCPFLYTWNGEEFEFVTDLMWRSPLGMILADGRNAPHQSARDFVLIEGERLRPADGQLWLQITEELWETAYVDRSWLLAVDHPAETALVVDEKFWPPPYAKEPSLHWLADPRPPAAARDHRGRDVLARLSRRDGEYVDDLPLTRYQGLTSGHSLEMTFAGVPGGERLRLVLWGWTFPTDTSINFALAQDGSRNVEGPSLEARAGDGPFTLVSPFVGFPSGKRKAMVVELTGRVPAGELTLRLSTTMQIYWDAAVLAVGEPQPPAVLTRLEPAAADLHYRGYSRLYRDSPSGPHLFDYGEVTTGPRFRDMAGRFTRFGPVAPLLLEEDDRYVVMNAGDELTLIFDASSLPELPPGWRRDYVLHTDGWVKDGDLHTAFSQTVEPWPYHGMDGYPATREYRPRMPEYLSRVVTGAPFRDALRAGD